MLEKFLPQHMLSKGVGYITRLRHRAIKNFLIKTYIRHYNVDMRAAERHHLDEYEHFNDFFTRKLKSEARPCAQGALDVIAPVDGVITEYGDITRGRFFQAKSIDYSLAELLAGQKSLVKQFERGYFMSFYLRPKDCHRVVMPFTGRLKSMTVVPGHLLTIAKKSIEHVPRLYAMNERVISLFETEFGPMAMIMVGSLLKGSIATRWAGDVTPPNRFHDLTKRYATTGVHALTLHRGQEMGHFNLGSSVIVLLPAHGYNWRFDIAPHHTVTMGECLVRFSDDDLSID